MNQIFKNILLILVILVHRSIEKLHEGFSVCKLNDPKFELCLNSAIENGIKLVKAGLPDYDIPSLDPFHIKSLKVSAGTGPVNLDQDYTDVSITGFTDVTINNSHIDLDQKVLRFSGMQPLLELKAQYNINGKILMMPVHGTGPCTLALENTYSDHIIEFKEVKKEGQIYYSPKSYELKLQPSHARYHLENLFDGNKLLGDNINKLINEEWSAIFRDVQEGYERAYASYFIQFTKSIFEKVPINEIFIL